MARSLVGVTGGATRTAITQHQARANNISDVAAKDGSQETLVNLLALAVNLAILPLLSEDLRTTWILFFALTALHLFANFKAVKSLNFETLNQSRLLLNFRAFKESKRVLRVQEANAQESVLLGLSDITETSVLGKQIVLGASFDNALKECSGNDEALKLLERQKYLVCGADSGMIVRVVILAHAQAKDVFDAYVGACFVASGKEPSVKEEGVEELFKSKLANAGWNCDYLQMGSSGQGWRGEIRTAQAEKKTN